MDGAGLEHLLRWSQSGVVAREQLAELGATHGDIERMLRRRELTRVRPGVFVNHTGPLTPSQLEWVAVLAAWPAALSHASAAPGLKRPGQIHLAIAHGRKLRPTAGVTLHRTTDFVARVAWNESPPRVRSAHAVIDVMASSADVASMFAALSTAAQTREVWPESLREAVATRLRLKHRALIEAMIEDFSVGANSVLERRWLMLERAHGLPIGQRQVRATADGRRVIRDVLYPGARLVVELDGRAWHDNARSRNLDAARDLAAAAEGLQTVRLTYGQVFDAGCATTDRIGTILGRAGWNGRLRRCRRCP